MLVVGWASLMSGVKNPPLTSQTWQAARPQEMCWPDMLAQCFNASFRSVHLFNTMQSSTMSMQFYMYNLHIGLVARFVNGSKCPSFLTCHIPVVILSAIYMPPSCWHSGNSQMKLSPKETPDASLQSLSALEACCLATMHSGLGLDRPMEF